MASLGLGYNGDTIFKCIFFVEKLTKILLKCVPNYTTDNYLTLVSVNDMALNNNKVKLTGK